MSHDRTAGSGAQLFEVTPCFERSLLTSYWFLSDRKTKLIFFRGNSFYFMIMAIVELLKKEILKRYHVTLALAKSIQLFCQLLNDFFHNQSS